MFDPDTFMSQTIDKPMETDYALVPEGEFRGMVADWTDNSKVFRSGEKDGRVWASMALPVEVVDENVRTSMNLQKNPILYYEGFLDFADDGSLDFGTNRNIKLGQLRAAVGQNVPGQAWSPSQLKGAGPFLIKVTHQTFERRDGTTGKKAVISKVTKLA